MRYFILGFYGSLLYDYELVIKEFHNRLEVLRSLDVATGAPIATASATKMSKASCLPGFIACIGLPRLAMSAVAHLVASPGEPTEDLSPDVPTR